MSEYIRGLKKIQFSEKQIIGFLLQTRVYPTHVREVL